VHFVSLDKADIVQLNVFKLEDVLLISKTLRVTWMVPTAVLVC